MSLKKYFCSGTLSLILSGLLLPLLSSAQADIHFSQFYETSILRNPALTGVFADDFKFGSYVRNQWSSISNPYQTQLVSGETHVQVSQRRSDFISFGVLGYADEAGSIDQRITAGYLSVAYNKSLNVNHPMFLSVGFTSGMLQYSFDPSKATFNNQYQNNKFDAGNPTFENLPNPKMSVLDMGAGVNFNSTVGDNATFLIGVSGYHFNQPEFSYDQLPGSNENIRWNVNGGMSVDVQEDVNMLLQANYAAQGSYTEIIMGGLVNYTAASIGPQRIYVFSAGVTYRVNDALIPVVKVTYKNLAIGVSYDINISTLTDASDMRGGYEFTLFYSNNYGGSNGGERKTVCPRFF